MNGRLSTSAALISLVFASSALAGLGNIRVQSHLGEKFDAIVPLSKLSTTDAVQISIASPSTFQSMNVEYDSILHGFSVSPVETINGQTAVRVRSRQVVNEPYVRLVLEEKSASGAKSFREYTVLLDPPELNGYSADAFPLNQAARPNRDSRQSTIARPSTHTKLASTSVLPRTFVVRPNQTLMALGRLYRPQNATLEQTTTAIFQTNLHAFYQQDPNRLKVGSKITVPSVQRILASSTRETLNLPSNTIPVIKPIMPPAEAVITKVPPVESSSATPQKEVVTDVAALVQRLEEKERSIRDAEERIKRLEASIEALKLGNLANVDSPNASRALSADSVPSTQLSPPVVNKPQSELSDAATADSLGNAIDWTLISGGVGTILLLGGAGVWLRARRKLQSHHPNAYDRVVESGHSSLDRSTQQTEMTQLGGHSFLTNVTQQGFAGLEPVEVDPVAEAEVYMAYGRNEQALDIIKEALIKNPTLLEVRIKGLELYKLLNRQADFERELQSLHGVLGGVGAMWTRVQALAKDFVPNHPLLRPENLSQTFDDANTVENDLNFIPQADLNQSLEDELESSLLSQNTPSLSTSQENISLTPQMTAGPIDLEAELQQAFVAPSSPPSPTALEVDESVEFSKTMAFDLDSILNEEIEKSALSQTEQKSRTSEPLSWEPSSLDFSTNKIEKNSTSVHKAKDKLDAGQAQKKMDAAMLAIEIGDEASGIALLKDIIAGCDEFSMQKKAMALLNDLDNKIKK